MQFFYIEAMLIYLPTLQFKTSCYALGCFQVNWELDKFNLMMVWVELVYFVIYYSIIFFVHNY